MGRASTQLVLFVLILNGVGGVITGSGLGAALDIDPQLGGQDAIDEATEQANQFEPSQGLTDTLFGMFVSAAMLLSVMYDLIFYGLVMLMNLGVPAWLVEPFRAAVTLIVLVDLIHIATGRDP